MEFPASSQISNEYAYQKGLSILRYTQGATIQLIRFIKEFLLGVASRVRIIIFKSIYKRGVDIPHKAFNQFW